MKGKKQEKQNDETKKVYDVFVSYRRERLETARNLVQALEKRRLRVYFDLEELDDGNFNEKLYDGIDQSKNAIFLMTEGALDECAREGDWVRNELEHVLKSGIKLILVNPSDVTVSFPDTLPPSLQNLKTIQVTKLDLGTMFNDSVNKIVKRLVGVQLAGKKTDDDLPVLGKPVDEVVLSGLTGQDAKHFKKALGYYNVVRYRSAWAEFKKIEEQGNAFVKYYVLVLGYMLEGNVDDADFEESCCGARDRGCTDAMRIFADRHLPNDTNTFDIVPPAECIQWLKKAIANGNADALADLGDAYEYARGVEKNLTTARELYKRSCEAGSLTGQMTYGLDCLLGNAGDKDLMTAGKVLRPVIAHLRKYEDELSAEEYCMLMMWYSDLNSNIVKPDPALVERYAKLAIGFKGRSLTGDASDKGVAYMLLGVMNLKDTGAPEKAKSAFECFQKEKAIDDKDGTADYWLGFCHENGIGVEADIKKALEYFESAVDKGDTDAQYALAIRLLADGAEQDVERGKMLLRLAAEGGNSDAMSKIGWAYLNGDGVNRDVKIAEEWFVKATEARGADAGVALGTHYAQGTFGEVDYPKAVEWWLKSAQQGDAAAMWNLGDVYQRGEKGVERNLRLSFDWFKRSAEAGDLDAMESLGLAYLQGLGTVADEDKAKKWLVHAAKNGNSSAECILGSLYARNDYWDKDLAEAVKWWTQAAEHKNAQAMCNLGRLFSDADLGDGTIQFNLEKARKWFHDADEAGNEDAAYYLGLDVLGVLGNRYETYAEWQEAFKALNPETGPARRILRKAGSWFQKPLDAHTDYASLAGACLRWLARIARYQEDLENAKDFYRQAAEKGDEKAKKELAEMESNGDGVGEPNVVAESRPSVSAAPQASVVPPSPAAPSVPVSAITSTVPPPAGDEMGRAEALFLRRARRLKKNDGRIDPDEKNELRELASELGLSVLRREELIEQVEEEYEAGM